MTRLVIALAFLAVAGLYIATTKASPSDSKAARRAVVVELFTSEGCSSCPPADELLTHLRQDLAAKNIQVIPLGFHVDYWNSLGWKDRFSTADYSRRQEDYAQSLRTEGPYTPQMVVDGKAEFVGNRARQAEREITEAAGNAEDAEIKLTAEAGDHLTVAVKSASAGANILLAITEDNLSTQVGAGENNGHTLHHAAVVRELQHLGQIKDGSFSTDVPLKLQNEWKRQDLRAVVFAQEGSAGKILGATSVALAGQTR